MTPLELRTSIALSGIFGLRLLGKFAMLLVLAIYAEQFGGGNLTRAGMAIGTLVGAAAGEFLYQHWDAAGVIVPDVVLLVFWLILAPTDCGFPHCRLHACKRPEAAAR